MVSYDNYGRKVGEINVVVRPEGGTIVTNTTFYGDRVTSQTVSVRDDQGHTETKTFYNGKVLP